ncbi:MAG: ADP-ribosylglycohydrolase family protein, partial [Candidatus Latescibacterota bacterium]
MLGLAVGDALGTTLEFQSPGSFEPLTDMVGGGPFGLDVGQWTDDTSMALCLAESLIACDGFDPKDQMDRYVRWWRDGYMSVTGHCFDIGNTVRNALFNYQKTGDPFSGSQDPNAAGNG